MLYKINTSVIYVFLLERQFVTNRVAVPIFNSIKELTCSAFCYIGIRAVAICDRLKSTTREATILAGKTKKSQLYL